MSKICSYKCEYILICSEKTPSKIVSQVTNICDSLSISWNHAISQYSKPLLSLSRSQGVLVIFLIKVWHLDITVRSTLKIHFINSWDRNFFCITTISRQFSRHKFKKMWGFPMRHDFLSMKLMKRKWKGRNTQKGNVFYNCLYQHILWMSKAKYGGDILLPPSELLSSTCTKICHKSASDPRIHGSYWKKILSASRVSLLLFSFHTPLWWNSEFLPLLALP